MAKGNGSHPDGETPPKKSALGPDDESRIKPEELPFYQEMMQTLEIQDRYLIDVPEEEQTLRPQADPDAVLIDAETDPFSILGHNHSIFYYMPHRSRQVIQLSAAGHTALNLLQLADMSWWARHYPGRNARCQVAWDVAADTLIRASHNRGIFDDAKLRGRGAWWDADRSVEHVGSHLYVDGIKTKIPEFPTRYIYEAGAKTEISSNEEITACRPAEAVKLIRVCELLPWDRPVNAKLFAGWIVCAMICGALKWRPHIWIHGSKGTGKTWVMQNIASSALGLHCLQVESNTTEAGIRAALGHDALPIIFDEAEPKDQQAAQRIQNVLMLMRSASSSQGSQIIKGSASGIAVRYHIRSCFAFASISVAATQAADQSRISVLGLKQRKSDAEAAFHFLKTSVAELLTEDFCARLHIRAVRMIAAIRRNADIFAHEAAKVFGSQRMGDQIGALLAGAWSLAKDSDVTPPIAADFISEQDWSEESQQEETNDETSCLSYLCEYMVRLEHGEKSIGELIKETIEFPMGKSGETLRRHGIRVEHASGSKPGAIVHEVIVSNTHSALKKIFRGTPWEAGHSRFLARLEGSRPLDPMRFADMSGVSRAIALPTRYF